MAGLRVAAAFVRLSVLPPTGNNQQLPSSFMPVMRTVMRETLANPPFIANKVCSDAYIQMSRNFSLVGLLAPVVILGILVYYRSQFLEAADTLSSTL